MDILIAKKYFEKSFRIDKTIITFDTIKETYVSESTDSVDTAYLQLICYFWIGFLKAWEIQDNRMSRL